jgi:hypothetical protein
MITLLSAGVSLAVGRGPVDSFLSKAKEAQRDRLAVRSGHTGLGDAITAAMKKISSGDTTAPETTISSGPDADTTATSASFYFSASETSTFACKLDKGRWSRCKSPRTYTGLALGTHQFAVRASDRAGNVDATPATWSWSELAPPPPPPAEEPPAEETPPPAEETVPPPPVEETPPPPTEETPPPPPADTTAPDTTILSGPSGTTTAITAAFAFSATESGSTFACKLDSGSWAACGTPKSLSGLVVGAHTFSVRATDAAGNIDSTPASRSWTVEAEQAPPPPPPPPAEGCTTTVSSVSAAQSSVASAAPGAVVCLANGSYGKVSLEATKAEPGVTLRAANPGGATIAGASLKGSNLTIARFVSTSSIAIQPGAKGMTVEHNRVTGGGQGIDGCPSSTTTCDDTAIIGNELIGPFGEDAIHLNRYHDGDGDGVGILIEGNEITNVRENGNHSDCLQTVWVGDHIVFRRNYLHDNRCQGFFVKDQASLGGVSGPIAGISVEDNLFLRNKEPCGPPLTSCGQPMYFQVFGPYSQFKMKRNTIWGDGVDSIAAFREGTGSDTVISSNVIYRLWTDTNMSGISLSENTLCSREGSWPSTRPGETMACSLSFRNTAADDYRLSSGGTRGVDWAPAEVHYGP